MRCPNCRQSMEDGTVSSPSDIMWTPKKKLFSLKPVEKGFKIADAKVLKPAFTKAYYCAECKLIVLDWMVTNRIVT